MADDEMVRSLWRAGYTGQMIGDYFGVTRSAALGKLFRLGLLSRMPAADKVHRVRTGRNYAEVRQHA